MERAGAVRLLSCYELGRQPLAVASAAACFERAGFRVEALDLSVEKLERWLDEAATDADRPQLVAISVPMHTALRIGERAAGRLRQAWPAAHLCFFGLYATLNSRWLFNAGLADSVAGGECEALLVDLARALEARRDPSSVAGLGLPGRDAGPVLRRPQFEIPARHLLPPHGRYAALAWRGERRLAAAIEASRGCLHHCRHCPIPPVYGGRFFIVPRETVLADVRHLVTAGVRHLTFADPDFFNGPGHVLPLVRAIHAEHRELTFDVTTKIENVLKHTAQLAELADCGCIFVVSAVESLSDTVLQHLDKRHTRADVMEAAARLDDAGIALRPSFVAFTPWTTLDDYIELIDWIAEGGLVDRVDPVQLSIRLLVPPGSLLADYAALAPHLGPLDAERFSFTWRHPDPRMDELQRDVAGVVAAATRTGEAASRTFERIRGAALAVAGDVTIRAAFLPARAVADPPRLTEPWFC